MGGANEQNVLPMRFFCSVVKKLLSKRVHFPSYAFVAKVCFAHLESETLTNAHYCSIYTADFQKIEYMIEYVENFLKACFQCMSCGKNVFPTS